MKFFYSSKTIDGQIEKGFIEAPNEAQASKALHERNLFVLDLSKNNPNAPSSGMKREIHFSLIGNRVTLKDKIVFTKQLAMMVRSGLPLIDAFAALEEQAENKYFAGIIGQIAQEVKGGKQLSETLTKYPKVFSALYIATVSSGEKSGKLDEVLERLAEQLSKDYELISKIKAAVTYPVVVVGALVIIGLLMFIFVIPQLKEVFTSMGVELPIITRIILGISDGLRAYWYIFVVVILGLIFGIRLWSKTENGGYTWDKLKLKIPVMGGIIRQIYMARFCRAVGTLIGAGLPMLEVITTAQAIISNRVYSKALAEVRNDVENGIPLSESLKKTTLFPPMVHHLASVGERSGKLDETFVSTADFFDQEVETTTSNLATLIEPILIMVIGAAVGLMVIAVIMPIYSLVNTI